MSDDPAPVGVYRLLPSGHAVCRLCEAADHAHTAACPVLTLRAQVRELAGQLGLLVATMREIMDAQDRLLRGEAEDGAARLP